MRVSEGGVLRGGSTRAEPAAGWRRRVEEVLEAWRERREAEAAPPPARRHPPAVRVARSEVGAALQAWSAVRAGVRLEDFLRQRLARYALGLPVALEALPARVEIEGGEVVVRAPPPRPRSAADVAIPRPEAAATQAWIRALEAREGRAVVREAQALEASLAALAPRAAEGRAHLDQLERALAADLASGALPGAADVEASAEQLGRPPVPASLVAGTLRAAALALLAAVAWRLAPPILAASGVPLDLAAAADRAPLGAGLALAFAGGAAAAIFTFLNVAVARLHALADGDGRRQRTLTALTAATALALAAGVAAAGAAPAHAAELVLVFTVPLASVLLLRQARRLDAERAVAEEAALGWDRARTAELVQRARRAEAVEAARAALAGVERERERLERQLRALERRAVAARRAGEEAAAEAAARDARLCEALAAALERDRYLFLRHAAGRSHDALARPARARARLEPAVADRLGVAG